MMLEHTISHLCLSHAQLMFWLENIHAEGLADNDINKELDNSTSPVK